MLNCPICKITQTVSFTVCSICGFDESMDREDYPTLSCSKIPFSSKAVRIRKYQQEVYEQVKKNKFLDTGNCGSSIEWKLYQNGTLLIQGNGMMPCQNTYPWGKWLDKIERLEILAGVSSVSACAFRGAKRLKTIGFPETLIKIEGSAFLECENLRSISLPDSLRIIGACAFRYCSELEEITLPKKCREIYAGAFGYCKKLKEISLPQDLKVVRDGLFKNCEQLSHVLFPGKLERIEADAFSGCQSLWSVQIPAQTKTSRNAFRGCKIEILREQKNAKQEKRKLGTLRDEGIYNRNVHWKFYEDGTLILNGTGAIGDIERTDLKEYPWQRWNKEIYSLCIRAGITSIGTFAFAYMDRLETVQLPDTLVEIGSWSFGECRRLKKIVIPSSVCSIGSFAFLRCDELTELILPEHCSKIGEGAFGYCRKLRKVILPKLLKQIEKQTFEGCETLDSVSFPDNLEEIQSQAFAQCRKLWFAKLPAGTKIEKTVFQGCNVEILRSNGRPAQSPEDELLDGGQCSPAFQWKLYKNGKMLLEGNGLMPYCEPYPWKARREQIRELEIKEGVRSISMRAFSDLTELEQVQFPDTLILIEDMAFWNCRNLQTLDIPVSVRCIGAFAFAYCSSLTEPSLPEYCPEIGDGAFSYCKKLKSVSLPGGMERICSTMFKGCENLSFVTIPNQLQEIQAEAFAGCKLLQVLPIRKETRIALDAFEEM